MDILEKLKHQVIISVQSAQGEPLYDEFCMNALMQSVVNGGSKALRLAGERDIKNAKKMFDVPIIGLSKPDVLPQNWLDLVYITPTVEDIKKIAAAGADVIAFDATLRTRPQSVEDLIQAVHTEGRLAMADIATFDDGVYAAEHGADIISTTMAGYTKSTFSQCDAPAFELLEALAKKLSAPVILEGRVWEISQVKKAFELGAYAVVIGSAVTRPELITKRFINYEKSSCF